MWHDVLAGLFRRPITTAYPAEPDTPPPTLRGALHWTPEGCTGCALCVKDCPSNALELEVMDRTAKHFTMTYHADRCIFCGQCAQNCRFDCITLYGGAWTIASETRDDYITCHDSLT